MNILSATPSPLKPTSYLNYIVNGRVAAPKTHKTHNFHATARKNFSTTEKQTPLQGPKPHNFFFAASPRTTGASLGEAPLPTTPSVLHGFACSPAQSRGGAITFSLQKISNLKGTSYVAAGHRTETRSRAVLNS